MAEDLREDAARLEAILPRVMRFLFRHDLRDPLAHLSVSQLRMMRLLAGEARVASDLSTELGMTPSAVSQTTHRLERMGLIERKTDEVDRRVRRIVLSSHGEQLMLERQALRVERARMALASLSENHRRRLIDSLDELIKSVGPGAAPKPDSLVFVAELEQTLLPMPPYSFPETKN